MEYIERKIISNEDIALSDNPELLFVETIQDMMREIIFRLDIYETDKILQRMIESVSLTKTKIHFNKTIPFVITKSPAFKESDGVTGEKITVELNL